MKYSFGNSKIPTTTCIINMSSAKECAMIETCPFAEGSGVEGREGKCYCIKAERMYTNVRDSRAVQTEYWRTVDNTQKLLDYEDLWRKHPRKMPTITATRFNESGDMRKIGEGGADDLELLVSIATLIPQQSIYTYTHNEKLMEDVDIADLPKNMCVNLSYRHDKEGFNTFVPVEDYNDGEDYIVCPGDCTRCSLCLEAKGLNIAVEIH